MRHALPFRVFPISLTLATMLAATSAEALVIRTTPRNTTNGGSDGFTTDVQVEGLGGDGNNAIRAGQIIGGIVSFRGDIIVQDSLSGGSRVYRASLDDAAAWGAGAPNGFKNPPTENPEGPWVGMHFPFRDYMNYEPSSDPDFVPGGNNDHSNNGREARVNDFTTGILDIFAQSDGDKYFFRYYNDPLGSAKIPFYSFNIEDLRPNEYHFVDITFVPDKKSGVVALIDSVSGKVTYAPADVEGYTIKYVIPSPGPTTLAFLGSTVLLARRRRR